MKRFLAALLLLAVAVPAWGQDPEKGWKAYKQGDYPTALRKWRPLAEQGDAWAQYFVGRMYFAENQSGFPPDDTEAAKWFRMAADQGLPQAQHYLGLAYSQGLGVPQNDVEAVKWFRKAAEQGDAKAQSMLGTMYFNGQGVPQDETEARRWYRMAAEQGYAHAQAMVGSYYAEAQGALQDHAEAAKWHRKAAEQGDANAQNSLGIAYGKGQGMPQDYVLAHMWFNLAAAHGGKFATKNRDLIAKLMTSADISKAQRLAREWLAAFEKKSGSRKTLKKAKPEDQGAIGDKKAPGQSMKQDGAETLATDKLRKVIEQARALLVPGTEWKIDVDGDFVTLSLTGLITYGERQRFAFKKGSCDGVIHYFSTYTEVPANFETLIGTVFLIEFNGEKIGARLLDEYKAFSGHLLNFNLGGYGKDVLLSHLKKNKKITIKFIDGNGYKASDYFDMPSNEWTIEGISEAFEKAYQACSQ